MSQVWEISLAASHGAGATSRAHLPKFLVGQRPHAVSQFAVPVGAIRDNALVIRSGVRGVRTSCGRFVHFLQSRGRDLLDATESDSRAYRVMRTQLQDRPVGDAAWAKEAQLLNQLYRWLVEQGHLRHRPLRMTSKGRNPLTPRVRRGMDIRHMTLAQYRYLRDVGLGGQLPNSQASNVFRGRAPIRNRAAADLALSTGMRPKEWSTVLLPELGVGCRRPGENRRARRTATPRGPEQPGSDPLTDHDVGFDTRSPVLSR